MNMIVNKSELSCAMSSMLVNMLHVLLILLNDLLIGFDGMSTNLGLFYYCGLEGPEMNNTDVKVYSYIYSQKYRQ